jgi:uncharacterized membrane protein YdjX (TVP38/TMEM64 family)
MDLVKILYEPYVIIIILSIIITTIAYFIIKNQLSEDELHKTNIPLTLLYTFVISFILLMIIKYLITYMNNKKYFQKAGGVSMSDRLTIVADDVDCGLLDD